tara:strand:- start:76 stop:420 length:345 start_codon:yes stop_codon:yes gene_type:complete
MKEFIIVSPRFCKAVSIFIDVYAITLFPFIVSKEKMDDATLNHERIHLRQQKELWVLGFYILYSLYWLKNRVSGMTSSEAYYALPFEKEAYDNDQDLSYLENRPKHAWRQYLSA